MVFFLLDMGVRHAHVPLPTRLLNFSFDISIFISQGIRGILDPWEMIMNDVEMLEVIVVILKTILIRGIEGFCFVIVC